MGVHLYMLTWVSSRQWSLGLPSFCHYIPRVVLYLSQGYSDWSNTHENYSINAKDVSKVWVQGRLFIQPKFRKFWLESKWNSPFWFGLARIFDNTFEGGPLWTVLLVWLKWLFPFDIIVVPATAHLYPAYKYLPKHTVAWVWGLHNWNVVSVPLGVRNFSKFWTRIFVEWNAP